MTRIIRKNQEQEQERYQELLLQYDYLQEEPYIHKREQLYLMVSQGCSDSFIRHFFYEDAGISSQDLDLMRSMALLAGEEFVLSRLFKRELEESAAIEQFKEELLRQAQKASGMGAVLKELEAQRERFALQIDFLKQAQEQAKGWYEAMLEKEKELMQVKAERNPQKRHCQRVGWRQKREERCKQRLLRRIVADPAYTVEQLRQILNFAQTADRPELEKLCDPAIPPEKMKLLIEEHKNQKQKAE